MPSKPGDWRCPSCNFSNFASRNTCKNCSRFYSGGGAKSNLTAMPPPKAGDWRCGHCLFTNFASRSVCKNCGVPSGAMGSTVLPAPPTSAPPTSVPATPPPSGPGSGTDWFCTPCRYWNFASRSSCHVCGQAKGSTASAPPAPAAAASGGGGGGSASASGALPPSASTRAGDWQCAKCAFSNFGSRVKCMQCGGDRPDVAVTAVSAPAISAFDTPSYWSGRANDKPLLESASFMAAHVAQVFVDAPSVRLQLDSVARIENVTLWLGYRAECERLRVKWATSAAGRCPPLSPSVVPKTLTGILDDTLGINEVYLMHATSRDVALKIVEGGFDPSFSGTSAGALFGAGTYFSDALEKVASYTRAGGAIIVARVALGDANGIHSTSSASSALRRPPTRSDGIESDSVVGCAATHLEYIVYRHTKAYPEFIVFLK